ncbi:unnamed protein product [Linum tenue]|uniref:non-specific serine/threonine protein kinase n=1 Tax=Linum tenue TaxID=586396 RepID=A0AAV0L9D0_9ROSI|nr:unnamed protein product [Linum tenue]
MNHIGGFSISLIIMELQTIFVLLPLIIFLPFCCSSSTDTIRFNESLADGQVLISSGKKYTLGFFSPGKSTNRYVGIWFTKLPTQEVVWVANRDDPINDTSSSLSIDPRGGGLVLNQRINGTAATLWSINVSTGENPVVARLLDEGNFVLLRQDGDRETVVLWQSFAHPTDTYLPYTPRKTGPDYAIRSWKSPDDPATGDWSYVLEPNGVPQLILYEGRTKRWRSGPWNGFAWSGVPDIARVSFFNSSVVIDKNDVTFTCGLRDPAVVARVHLHPSGTLSRDLWQDKEGRWDEVYRYPTETCDVYGKCGPNGNCDPFKVVGDFPCICLPGFEPRSSSDWFLRDALGGCVRKRATRNLGCGGGDGFVKLENAKVPDTRTATADADMNLSRCEQECLRNCSCTAYASSNLTSGIGCMRLYGDLVDTRVLIGFGQDLYVRVDAIELAEYRKQLKGQKENMKVLAIVLASVGGTGIILGASTMFYCLLKWKRKGSSGDTNHMISRIKSESQKENLYEDKDSVVPTFDVLDIFAATENFSAANKLGQGGFGSVHKGTLSNGQEIAVKRLSQTSRQGIGEFKNEVRLVSKLQHKNLARIFGCCIHGEDKMLVYEYLPNRSLDFFIGYMSPEYAMEGLYSTKSDIFSFGVLTLEIVSSTRSNQCYQARPSSSLIGYVWDLWSEGRSLDMVDSSTMGESFSTDQVMRCVQIGLLCVQESPIDRPIMLDVVFMLGNANTLPSPKKPAFIGTLSSGQEIAVKRLSQTSRQGIREFKNEVRLVSKLQHKNLARIFGCCIHGEDKMLVYEYLPNRSLDFFIGYMSPEYAMEGLYSTKSDVFSFGVLTLEIVSSTRSNQCYQGSSSSSLIGHVWDLWSEGRALDMVDSSTMGESFSTEQVMRCIQIGLLCVQEFPTDRPAMSDVVFMLGNATTLPSPKKPAFVLNKKYDDADPATSSATGSSGVPSVNRVSITTLVAR